MKNKIYFIGSCIAFLLVYWFFIFISSFIPSNSGLILFYLRVIIVLIGMIVGVSVFFYFDDKGRK